MASPVNLPAFREKRGAGVEFVARSVVYGGVVRPVRRWWWTEGLGALLACAWAQAAYEDLYWADDYTFE
jgi:hypothetical protein